MTRKLMAVGYAAVAAFAVCRAADLVSEVRLDMGTSNERSLSHGNLYPAVTRPWGMSAWAPMTSRPDWEPKDWQSGFFYDWKDFRFYGLRQTHQPSPWVGDFGAWSVLPVTGRFEPDAGRRMSHFSHASETAEPAYYRVYLPAYDVAIELTPTERSAAMRVTYPATDAPGFVVNSFGGEVRVEGDRRIRGTSRKNRGERSGVAANFANRFVLEFDRPFVSSETAAGAICVRFPPMAKGEVLGVKASSSFISDEQADQNLKEVSAGFDELRAQGREAWNEALGRIAVEGGSARARETFYTCLYRALHFPRAFHEVGADGVIRHYSPSSGKVEEGRWFYGTGFWDTFRALFPLITFVYPDKVGEMMEGYQNWIEETGWFPEWSSPGLANCMIGNNSFSALADAILAGVKGNFDPEVIYRGMLKCANAEHPTLRAVGRFGFRDYNELGYIPRDVGGARSHVTARTLEYAYDDWCVARLGERLGRPKDEVALYEKRSGNWRNVFDRSRGLVVGRSRDGSFDPDFNPFRWDGDLVEGNSYHYSFAALHDVPGLIEAMGGREKFVATLDFILSAPPVADMTWFDGNVIHEALEMQVMGFGQYAHGNQPSQHQLYLYGYAGELGRTQHWVREAMNRLYAPTPDGFCGDEDNGQTSAWYVWSALGLYPVCPVSGEYALGAPLFPKATVTFPGGRRLVVTGRGLSDANRETSSIAFDGRPVAGNVVRRAELSAGGTLVFTAKPESPNRY